MGTLAAQRAHEEHCKLALQRAVWAEKLSLSHELRDSGDHALHSFVIQFAKSRFHGARLLNVASEFNMRPLPQKLIDARWGPWGVDLDVPCHPGGETAMCVAARHGHSDVLRALIKAGAAINDGYSDAGITPLHLACGGGHTSAVHVLLFARANVYARRVDNNKTPLHAACHGGNADIVEMLLKNNADVNACATQGGVSINVSPLFEAAERGDTAVINLLVRAPGIEYRRLRTSDESSVIAVARSNGHVQISEQLVMAANWADRVEYAVNEASEDSDDNAESDARSDAEAISSDDDEPLVPL
jgi:ankyrin repeat protein